MADDKTIEDVILELDGQVAWSREQANRIGYFAALYRGVTVAVRDALQAGSFDNGPLLERLDVVFAQRYLDAVFQVRNGQQPTLAWQAAFGATHAWRPVVLQHVLLGMNAHINLDLAIAAARTAPGPALPSLRPDFNRINDLLASMLDTVQRQLAEIWPPLRWLLKWVGRGDDVVVNFSLRLARQAAWRAAEDLAALKPSDQQRYLDALDRRVALLARAVRHPGWFMSSQLLGIRLGERGTVPEIIDILSGIQRPALVRLTEPSR